MQGWGGQGWVGMVMMGVLLVLTGPAWADEPQPQVQATDEPNEPGLAAQIGGKFVRGVANFGFGWVEFPKQIHRVGRERGWLAGAFRGSVEGLGMFLARTIAGMYEIFSFPVPLPPHYQPLVRPEFVWQPEPAAPVRSAPTTVGGATETNPPATP